MIDSKSFVGTVFMYFVIFCVPMGNLWHLLGTLSQDWLSRSLSIHLISLFSRLILH